MSLEALSHAASTAFPIFEEEQLRELEKEAGARRSKAMPRASPLRRACSLGTDIIKDLQNQRDLSSVLPSVPTLSRHLSHPCYNLQNPKSIDWSRLVTLEERTYIRDKIKTAYERKAPSYEDLLELTCAIEEEFVFAAAPSRLDYFKSGVQFEKRVSEKQVQMKSGLKSNFDSRLDVINNDNGEATNGEVMVKKKVKTEK